jgi:hypothetical protein
MSVVNRLSKGRQRARYWWLTPVILATWEAEISRIQIQSQPRQIVLVLRKNP